MTPNISIVNVTFQLELQDSPEPVRHLIDIHTNFLLRGSIAVFGTVSNIVNMVIFYRLGLKDSMSVGLMALSFTDFLISFVCVSAITYIIWDKFFPDAVVGPLPVENVSFGWVRDLLFLCSNWITAIISVERCMCVTFPFKVKQIFTRSRCAIAVVVVYVVHISMYAPIFASHWLQWATVEAQASLNATVFVDRLVVMYSRNRPEIMMYSNVVTGAASPITSQAIVLVSVIWMAYGLRASSRIRGSGTTEFNKPYGADYRKEDYLSNKEKRLVKVMLSLAIILTLCNIPRFMAKYAVEINPEINYGKKMAHMHTFLWTLTILTCTINSSVNIFVYLTINSSFRAKFKEILSCSKVFQA